MRDDIAERSRAPVVKVGRVLEQSSERSRAILLRDAPRRVYGVHTHFGSRVQDAGVHVGIQRTSVTARAFRCSGEHAAAACSGGSVEAAGGGLGRSETELVLPQR